MSTGVEQVTNRSSNASECIICHEPLNKSDPEAAQFLICGHVFHTPCINSWFEKKRICPICDTPQTTQSEADLLQGVAARVFATREREVPVGNQPQALRFDDSGSFSSDSSGLSTGGCSNDDVCCCCFRC